MEFILLAIGLLIILVLAVIAIRLRSKIHEQEEKQRQQQKDMEAAKEEQQNYLNNSVQVLARGLIDKQVSLTEGSIRISVLLGNLDSSEEVAEEFSAFFQLAEATSHIPILDAWKQLPKKEKMRFDKERLDLEFKYEEFILDAAQRIKDRRF